MAPQIAQWNVNSWGDGSVWGPLPQPQPIGKKMKAILHLNNANPEEIHRVGKNVNQGFTDNPTVFTDPEPPLATTTAHNKDLDDKITAVKTAEEARTAAILARDAAAAVVVGDLNVSLPYVQKISGGDPVIIGKANLDTKSQPTPGGKLPQVQNLSLTTGDNPGETDGHHDTVPGRKIYEIWKCTGDPTVEANWSFAKNSSPSKFTVAGHPSGSRLWLRVRAKAPKDENDGTWSQPATIIVP